MGWEKWINDDQSLKTSYTAESYDILCSKINMIFIDILQAEKYQLMYFSKFLQIYFYLGT